MTRTQGQGASPNGTVTKATQSRPFKLWRPTLWDHVCRMILSESFAWAVQNAIGVLFTILFSVVWRMTFTLACVSSALYSAASQILSLDRTVGGRLFSGSLFVGCMLSGGVVGGALASLAWVAHGQSKGLYHYFTTAIEDNAVISNISVVREFNEQELRVKLGEALEYLPEIAARPIPSFLQEPIAILFKDVSALFPPIDDGFWILLMVFFVIFAIPFAAARASENLKIGLLMAIASLFMGSQMLFATLMPTLGLREYWTQIVTGYIKVALVNGGAMVCTAIIMFVKSSYDTSRVQMGDILKRAGTLTSKIASECHASRYCDGTQIKNEIQLTNGELDEVLRKQAAAIAESDVPLRKFDKSFFVRYKIDEESGDEIQPMPVYKNGLELRSECQLVEDTLSSALFEPPLPQLTSQWGAKRADYCNVLEGLTTILSTLSCMETIYMEACRELVSDSSEVVLSDLVYVMASISSVYGIDSDALSTIPIFKPSYGNDICWKPQSEEFWNSLQEKVKGCASMVSNLLNEQEFSEKDDALPAKFNRGRYSLLLINNCESLVKQSRKLDRSVFKALACDIPESSKEEIAPELGLKDRIFGNAYLPSVLIHTALGTGLAVWALVIHASIKITKGTWRFFSSKKEMVKILKNRYVQFGIKYWFALSISVVGIVLILWKGKSSSGNTLEDAYDLAYFFFVWQPIYFWITVAICVQFQVEAAAFRAVARTTMSAIGGTLGWFTMMNGYLANNPYFLTCITCLFNGVCGLLSPIKSIRYSLFLVVFTFNAVTVCQYFGCCDVAGETKVYGGKVLSTLLGSIFSILMSWCVFPYYTSERMLTLEYNALKNVAHMIEEIHHKIVERPEPLDESGLHKRKKDWESRVKRDLEDPLALVRKELELNTVDKKQLLIITWTILPTPKVVPIIMSRLEMIVNYLREVGGLYESSTWHSGNGVGQRQQSLIQQVSGDMQSVFNSMYDVVYHCKLTMDAVDRKELKETRNALAEKVNILSEARAGLVCAYNSWNQESSEKWESSELKFLAMNHLLLLCIREIQVIGIILSETEAVMDRDRWFTWLASWYGRRPF